MAVAMHEGFFETLPDLPATNMEDADIAWLIYSLKLNRSNNKYQLRHARTVYTKFESALESITTPRPGNISDFLNSLQDKLDEKLENSHPPDAPTLTDIMEPRD